MYFTYYDLSEQPFGVTPDLRYLYFGPSHQEALASLYHGLETGRGFLLLVAVDAGGRDPRRGLGRTVNPFVQELGVEVKTFLRPGSKVRNAEDGHVLLERQTSTSGAGTIAAGAREEEKI